MTSYVFPHIVWEKMRKHTPTRRRHPHKVLTTREVQGLNAPGRFADGGGLYLLVAPGGSKSWILRTVVMGTRRDIGLGSIGLVSLAEAREEARRLRKIARDDGDPLAERRRRAVPSFEDAAKQVHAATPDRSRTRNTGNSGCRRSARSSRRLAESGWTPSRAPTFSPHSVRTG